MSSGAERTKEACVHATGRGAESRNLTGRLAATHVAMFVLPWIGVEYARRLPGPLPVRPAIGDRSRHGAHVALQHGDACRDLVAMFSRFVTACAFLVQGALP